jgi:hypothetical protein
VPPPPASYPIDSRRPIHGGKEAGSEADHRPPNSAELKKVKMYTYTLPNIFICTSLLKKTSEILFPEN